MRTPRPLLHVSYPSSEMGLRWNSTLVALLSFALGVLTLTQLCLSTQAEDAHVFFHAKVAYALTAVFVAMCFLLGYYQRVTMAQATALMGLIAFAFTVATVTHVAREWKYCRNISHASKVSLVGCTSGQRDGGQSTSTTDQMCAIAGQVSAGRCIIAFAGDMDEMNTLDDISQATIGLGVTSMLLIAAIVATIVTQFWAHGSAKIRLQDSLFWYQVQKTPEWPGHREAMELFAELNPDSRAKYD